MAATDAGNLTAAAADQAPPPTSSAAVMADDTPLPGMREDIRVQPGPRDHAGRPTWTLYDPLRNKFFQLDERALHLVYCWGEGTPGAIAAAVAERFPWQPDVVDIAHFFDFLAANELLLVRDGTMRKRLEKAEQARQTTLYNKLLHNYLFFRLPLTRPDPWLDRLYPHVAFLLTSRFLVLSAVVGIVSLALLLRQWQTFVGGFPWFFSTEGMIVFGLTLATIKILHEMGHALACKKYGVRVATMGVSFIVMWPVLYTDATDGWRLTSRRQRATISAAGVTTELVLACYALAAWLLLPEGLPRSVAFTVATTTLVMSLLVNLNPLMRFDGYFFLSDTLNMPNLQERSFGLARWQLRTWLFGRLMDPPEHYSRRLHAILVAYAISTWIYRLFLFLGIALLVYHMFFKALGIFLFFVEIWFFIARPIYREFKAWPDVWKLAGTGRRRGWYLASGGVLLVLLFPWRQDFVVQGQWSDARYERIHAVRVGRVEEVLVTQGQAVQAGQVMLRLSSPELDHQQRVVALDVLRLRSQLERSLTDNDLSADRLVMSQALQRAEAEHAALDRVREQLVVLAPLSGRVEDVLPGLHVGRWVTPKEQLLMVREGAAAQVSALVPESKLEGLETGGEALFFAEAGGPKGVPLTVTAIERSAVKTLDSPYFAVDFGGDIPASRQKGGEGLAPEISVYRVHLRPGEGTPAEELPDRRLRGWVHFEGERRTLLGRALRFVLGVLVRESAF